MITRRAKPTASRKRLRRSVKRPTQASSPKDQLQTVHHEQRSLRRILQGVPDGITVHNAAGRILYVNDAGAQACGFASASVMMKLARDHRAFAKALRRFEIRDEAGDPFPWERLPGRRALRGEKNSQAVINYYDTQTGKARWSLVKARAITDPVTHERLAINIWSDITEREELEKRKDHFIGMASHELKTPITTLKVFTHVLKKYFESAGAVSQQHYVARMDEQLNRLSKLVSSLLDISRIQMGKLPYDETYFDITAVARSVAQDIQSITSTHTITVRGNKAHYVWGDADRIGQVLINLITNAIKYSPNADRVGVAVENVAAGIKVAIRDFGMGVPKRHQTKIFERFYRGYDTKQQTFPGLGIGLFLSSEIIKHHHGKIGVTSGPRTGSTFYFILPKTKTQTKARLRR